MPSNDTPLTDAEVGRAVRKLWEVEKSVLIEASSHYVFVEWSRRVDELRAEGPTLDAALRAALAAREERG